jgi:hypothetical protein
MEARALLRRKVLRGTLAAPVVLTVSSASAATSSFARCLANTNTTPDAFFTTTADSWFRTQVPVTGLWSQGQDLGYFYNDPMKNVFVSVNSPYTALTFNAATIPNNVKVTTSSTRWAVVWFDKATTTQYTKITLQQPFGSSATTMSCYGSFNKS